MIRTAVDGRPRLYLHIISAQNTKVLHLLYWACKQYTGIYWLLCYHPDCQWCKPYDKSVLTDNSGLVADAALIAVVFETYSNLETYSTLETVKHK